MARPSFSRPAQNFARPAQNFSRPSVSRPSFARHESARPNFRSVQHSAPSTRAARHFAAPSTPSRAAATKAASRAAATTANTASTQKLSRAQLRQQRRQDLQSVRNLPRSQRAQALRNLRAQRLQQQNASKQNATTQQNTANRALTTGSVQNNKLRNGTTRLTTQQARQNRFASLNRNATLANASTTNTAGPRVASGNWAARRAWRHHWRAPFVAWFGPVFWPYAYSDIFDYTFWPYGYDPDYWGYAYDDLFDSVFWADAGPYPEYAYAEPDYGYYGGGGRSSRSYRSSSHRTSTAAVRELCGNPGNGITAWPFGEIRNAVQPTADQLKLLDQLKQAAAQAADDFKASCPVATATPMTPPGRLQAVMNRVGAVLDAVHRVRPALEAFYNSLSDEQKARFNEIGPSVGKPSSQQAANNAPMGEQAANCGGDKSGLSNFPIQRIEDVVKPTEAQQSAVDQLEQANSKAVSILQAACPTDTPQTPVGRMAMMEKRLNAMLDAGKTMQPALENFYASLSNEQKARFNTLNSTLQNGG